MIIINSKIASRKDKILYTIVTVTDTSLEIHPSVITSLDEAKSIIKYMLQQNQLKNSASKIYIEKYVNGDQTKIGLVQEINHDIIINWQDYDESYYN